MTTILRAAAFFLAADLSLHAQNPAPPQAPTPASTIRTNVRLVVVDVVVKDKSHHVVRGLPPSSFTLLENGKPQTIRNFEEHTAESPPAVPATIDLPPGNFSNFVTAPQSPALNIVLIDSLNTPFDDQIIVRQQLLDYLKHAKPGTRTAIFGLTTRLLLLQGFTSDPARLRAVLEKKVLPHDSPLLPAPEETTSNPGVDPSTVAAAQTVSLQDSLAAEFDAYHSSFKTQTRVIYTLSAMNSLGRYLSSLPGRKNLIWFSGSFPINILPSADGARNVNGFAGAADMQDEFRETTDLLSRARVSVYPVNARGVHGLSTDSAGAGDAFGDFRTAAKQAASNESDALSTMDAMADQTGGHAFYNTNDLARAVSDAVEDGSYFYTLAYSPTDPTDDGSYRSIKVTLDRGASLEYRRGYYADDAKHDRPQDLSTHSPMSESTLQAAMTHGAPDSTQLIFRIAAAPVKIPIHPVATLDNITNAAAKGPFATINLHFLVDPANLGFIRVENNRFEPSVRFVAFVYDRDGHLLQGSSRSATSSFDAAQVHNILQRGLQYPLEVDVPASGDFFLRVGVVDRIKRRFGSLEIPLAAIRALPAVEPLASSPAASHP